MIRSIFASFYKNKLKKWWNEKKVAIQEEYDVKEKELVEKIVGYENQIKERVEILERKKRDLEDDERRVQDRKEELERVNSELKNQIRIIEAKCSPSNIWETSFSQGFSKAWDMMIPIMKEGLDKAREKIRDEEIEASLPRVDLIVEQRVKELGSPSLLETHQLQAKKREFEAKMNKAIDSDDKSKFKNYIHVIDWILGSRNGN